MKVILPIVILFLQASCSINGITNDFKKLNVVSFFRFIVYVLFGFVFISSNLQGQTKSVEITGIIIDSMTSKPLGNVNIFLRNKKTGTTSNEKGRFKIAIESIPEIVRFSFVGYKTKQILISKLADTNLVIKLKPEVKQLEEVVIIDKKDIYNLSFLLTKLHKY